ncbi:MAG: PPC domain-containing protein [bacterium]|nr:PPC domain-containing protein [bacterium]
MRYFSAGIATLLLTLVLFQPALATQGCNRAASATAADLCELVQQDREIVEAGEIISGTPQAFDLLHGQTLSLTFRASAGQLLDLNVLGEDGVDALFVLLAPNGRALVASDNRADDDLNPLLEHYAAPANGTYTLLVTLHDDGDAGAVEIAVEVNGTLQSMPDIG